MKRRLNESGAQRESGVVESGRKCCFANGPLRAWGKTYVEYP